MYPERDGYGDKSHAKFVRTTLSTREDKDCDGASTSGEDVGAG